jgi:transposase
VIDLLQTDPHSVILAWDEAHVWAQLTPHCLWSPIGHTPSVSVWPQRHRVVFYGALNLRSGHEHALITERMNQPTSAMFIQHLLDLYPDHPILLIADRASWHKGRPVQALLDANPRLHIFYLPPACPDLNPQEHVWSWVRRSVNPFTRFSKLVTDFWLTLQRTCFRPILFEHYAPPILSFLSV